MGLRVISRTTTNAYDGTSATYLQGNVGDWVVSTLLFEVDCFFQATSEMPVTISGDTITRLSGSFIDDGFALGDTVSVIASRYESDTPTTDSFSDSSAIITAITDTYITIDSIIFNGTTKVPFPDTDKENPLIWEGLYFAIRTDKEWRSFNIKHNLIPNFAVDSANFASEIDGMETEFHFSDKLYTDTVYVAGTKLSEQSGNSVNRMYIKGDGGGTRNVVIFEGVTVPLPTQRFYLRIEHQIVGLFDDSYDIQNNNYPEWFLNSNCLSDNVTIRAYTTENDENTTLTNDTKASITKVWGDTGWFNESLNGKPNEFEVLSVDWEDDNGNAIPSLSYNEISICTITIDDPYADATNSRYSFGVCYLPEDDDDYKENQLTNAQNLCLNDLDMHNSTIQQHTASPIVATVFGFANTESARIDVLERHFEVSGTTLTVTIKFQPNAEFANFIGGKDALNRKFACWVGLGNPSKDFAKSNYVNLLCDTGQMTEVEDIDGTFSTQFTTIHLYDDQVVLDQLYGFPEDDILLQNIRFPNNITDLAPMSSFKAQIRLANIVDLRTVVLDEVTIDFNGNTTLLPDGTQEINGVTLHQPRSFYYPVSFDFRDVEISRYSSLDTADERWYTADIPMRLRWEWFIENNLIPTDFFDGTDQNNGLNEFWYRLQNDPDWKLIIVFLREHTDGSTYSSGLDFTGVGGGYDFTMLDYFDTTQLADCSIVSKYTTFDYDASPVTTLNMGYSTIPYEGYDLDYNLIKASGLTRLEVDWSSPCLASVSVKDVLFAEICIEVWEGGGFKTMYKIRNDQPLTPNNPLVGITDPTLIDITNPVADTIRFSVDINGDLLPNEPYFKISSKIGYRVPSGDVKVPSYQRTFSKALFSPLPEPDPCECKGLKDCQYEELALADLTDDASYRNDIKGLWYKRKDPAFDVDFFIKDEDGNETPLNDGTFGTFYDFGSFVNDSNLKGYHLEWRRVLAVLGAGKYILIRKIGFFGLTSDFESYPYNCQPFSDDIANQTVRIISKMDGSLLDKEVNFKGTEWIDGMRIRGFFGDRQASLEKETITTIDNKVNQVKADILNEYELRTNLLPDAVVDYIIEYHSLANEIWISDYNIYNHSYKYIDKSVQLDNFNEIRYPNKNRSAILSATFSDRYLNLRKNNCGDLTKTEPPTPPSASPVPPCEDAEWNLKDEDSNSLDFGSIGSGLSADIVAPNGDITINSVAFDDVLSGGTTNIVVEDTDGSPVGSEVGGAWVVPAVVDDLTIIIPYETSDDTSTFTILADSAGTIDTVTTTLTSVVIKVNAVIETVPFTLVATDVVEITYDPAGSDGIIKLEGEY